MLLLLLVDSVAGKAWVSLDSSFFKYSDLPLDDKDVDDDVEEGVEVEISEDVVVVSIVLSIFEAVVTVVVATDAADAGGSGNGRGVGNDASFGAATTVGSNVAGTPSPTVCVGVVAVVGSEGCVGVNNDIGDDDNNVGVVTVAVMAVFAKVVRVRVSDVGTTVALAGAVVVVAVSLWDICGVEIVGFMMAVFVGVMLVLLL